MKTRNISRAVVALLATVAIVGPASAAQIPGNEGEPELVLTDEDKASVGDGFVYLLTLGFVGDFWGTKDKKYAYVDPEPSQGELGAPLSILPEELKMPLAPSSPLAPTGPAGPSANTTPTPEPSAVLLMAVGMVFTGMHLRGRRSA